MADTIQNIKLTANTWVDLYAGSSITVGVKIVVENLTTIPAKLHTSAASPSATDAKSDSTGSFSPLHSYSSAVNDTGDSGAWAYSDSDGLVNVKAF
jgi:hypothetical protein